MRDKNFYELKQKAADYIQRCKFENAIDIYKSLIEAHPKDTALQLKLANVYQTVGQESASITCYMKILDIYCHESMIQQGIAVCRMILALDPHHVQARQTMVDLYVKEFGSLPGKRGDTILPPSPTDAGEHIIASGEKRVRCAGETGAELRYDSWSPVDVIFSNADAQSPNWELKSDLSAQPADNSDTETADEEFGVDITDEIELYTNTDNDSSDAQYLLDKLRQVSLFATVNTESLERIIVRSAIVHYAKNELILKEGEIGDSFFVILNGFVQVYKGELMTPVAGLGANACFGEMALFGHRARRASVIALEPATLLQISYSDISFLQHRFPAVRQTLRRNVRERVLDNMLITNDLFSPFTKEVRAALHTDFQPEEFLPYEPVINMGDKVAFLYLIVDGRAEVILTGPDQKRQLICTLGIGEVFGEFPLLTDSPSKVTVRAQSRLSTLCLPGNVFNQLMTQHPNVHHMVMEMREKQAELANYQR